MIHASSWFRQTAATANFEGRSTPRTWLRSTRNFGNARFRRFATFDFSTPKKFVWQNFRIKESYFRQFGEVLEDLRPNGRQNQLPRQILLRTRESANPRICESAKPRSREPANLRTCVSANLRTCVSANPRIREPANPRTCEAPNPRIL